jgi:hypothetical protein
VQAARGSKREAGSFPYLPRLLLEGLQGTRRQAQGQDRAALRGAQLGLQKAPKVTPRHFFGRRLPRKTLLKRIVICRTWPTSTRSGMPPPLMPPGWPRTASLPPIALGSLRPWPASRRTGRPSSPSTRYRSATASGCGPPTSPSAASKERRRTKVIPRLSDEKAALELAASTMIRAAQRWCRVSVNDLERHQLALLRAELGLDPPPSDDQAARSRRTSNRRVAA